MKEVVNSKNAPEPIGPYSQAIKSNSTIYVSGQIALNRLTGTLIQDSIENETEQVMINLNYVLKEGGFSFNDVVKCTIFIKDMDDFQSINKVYGKYFIENPPARETVEVSRLPKDVNVEISCIAEKQ